MWCYEVMLLPVIISRRNQSKRCQLPETKRGACKITVRRLCTQRLFRLWTTQIGTFGSVFAVSRCFPVMLSDKCLRRMSYYNLGRSATVRSTVLRPLRQSKCPPCLVPTGLVRPPYSTGCCVYKCSEAGFACRLKW